VSNWCIIGRVSLIINHTDFEMIWNKRNILDGSHLCYQCEKYPWDRILTVTVACTPTL